MTDLEVRQSIADRINAKVNTATTVEEVAYLIDAYNDLNKEGLNLVYSSRELKNILLEKMLQLSENGNGRDIKLTEKYIKLVSNHPPTNPTNNFPTTLHRNQTYTHAFIGATDPEGSVTHYIVDQISSSNLTVQTAEVASGTAHVFTVGSITTDETVTFRVRAKDNEGAYSSGITVTVRLKSSSIGVPGEIGFGVGIAPSNLVSQFNLIPMCGYDNPAHPNYGNYMDASGSIMVFIPKHYVKLSYDPNPPYYGLRVDVSDTPQNGYSLPRCFINNGVEVAGIFVDKYLGGREGNVMVSKRWLDPVSTHQDHNPISNLTANGQAPQNRLDGMYSAVKTRGSNYSLTTIFTYTMLANLADAHYQACYRKNNFSACAWADVAPYQPKGNNNNALRDINDSSVVYTRSGYSNCGHTGGVADAVFAKITHNGQKCGVTDLNGNMWEAAAGYITDSSGRHLVLKESVDVKNLTPTSAYDTNNYDQITMPLTLNNTGVRFGNGTNQVFSGDTNRTSNAYKLDNLGLPMNDNAISSNGTTRFGNDGFARVQKNEMCPIVSGHWNDLLICGVRVRDLANVRSYSLANVGGRACLVPSVAG